MMFRVPNRAIRYAVITNYAVRDALKDIDVDLGSVEETMTTMLSRAEGSLQDTVNKLTDTVQSLINRLEALEESQPDGPQEADDIKAEAKRKASRGKTARKGDSKA